MSGRSHDDSVVRQGDMEDIGERYWMLFRNCVYCSVDMSRVESMNVGMT